MSPSRLKQFALNAYRLLTSGQRARLARSLSESGNWPAAILFYHRVANTPRNDWTIPLDVFSDQLDWLETHSDVVSLADIQSSQVSGRRRRLQTALTFDDGYGCNLENALLDIARRGLPCTYFVSTNFVETGECFPHDVAIGQSHRPHSLEEIRQIAELGIEIGGHTASHLDLGKQWEPGRLSMEIGDSRKKLQDWSGQTVDYFAFPYGLPTNISPAAIDAVVAAGYRGFVSAYGDWNWTGNGARHLRRIHADPDLSLLQNWLTLDPRKTQPGCNTPVPFSWPGEAVAAETDAVAGQDETPSHQADDSFDVETPQPTTWPLKTAFVITSMPVGGAETLLVNLIRRLDRRLIEPSLYCLKELGPLGEELASEIPAFENLITGKWDIGIVRRLSQRFRANQIEAVITVGAGDKMFWGRLAANAASVPVVGSALHSTGWPDGVGKLNRLLTRWTDRFIAVAESHGEFLVDFERFPLEKVCVIPNGIDTDRFVPNQPGQSGDALSLRSELGLADDSQLVGILAALRPEKNHGLFIEMASRIRNLCSDAHFVVIGDGPERPHIESLIEEHGLFEHVHLLGTRSDTPRLLAALDVFTLTSHNEANPVSILEALSCGVPVVATNVGSVRETVVDGETGYLVDAGSVEQLVANVTKLLHSASLRADLGSRGRELVLRNGSLDSMVRGYEQMICQVMATKRSDYRMPTICRDGERAPAGSVCLPMNLPGTMPSSPLAKN
jgi:glycosyltransferase involved in cell wall biosynthesis/peptidoglycan/xylan/chitin deacetylase (PgdA/CDA1 family)